MIPVTSQDEKTCRFGRSLPFFIFLFPFFPISLERGLEPNKKKMEELLDPLIDGSRLSAGA